jgi:regulator of replication initiation timing
VALGFSAFSVLYGLVSKATQLSSIKAQAAASSVRRENQRLRAENARLAEQLIGSE